MQASESTGPCKDASASLSERMSLQLQVRWLARFTNVLVVSLHRGGPQYRPKNIIILIMGTPAKVPLIFEKP